MKVNCFSCHGYASISYWFSCLTIRFFQYTPFSYAFDLETSTDGAKWELILANGNGKFSLERQSIPVKRKVRYIRWTARGGNRIGHFFLAGSRIYGY